MAAKKMSGSKKSAGKKKAELKNLSRSGQELSKGRSKAVKGGGDIVVIKSQDTASPPLPR